MRVVDEADAVQVDDAQVGRVRFDLADVDHLVDLFRLLVRQLERSCAIIMRHTAPHRIRAYSKRAVQPICAVQNEKLCSPKTQS